MNKNYSNKEYSEKEMEQILKSDMEVPEYVNERIQDTYKSLGIQSGGTVKYRKKHRAWTTVAAAAALVAGLSITGFAASRLLSVSVSDKDGKVQYAVQVDNEKPAHKIEVEPTYMPEGYELGDENSPFGGKWHNNSTGGGITIIPINAAELYLQQELGDSPTGKFSTEDYREEINLDGQKLGVFVSDDSYVDSEDTVKNIYLFNEEEGYMIQVWSKSDLPAEELLKVAKGLKVTVLDETVPYATQAEIEAELQARENWNKENKIRNAAGVDADRIYAVGDAIGNPYAQDEEEVARMKEAGIWGDVLYTVVSAEVKDSISPDEYPAENFINYDEVAPWMNEDGTLKPHERYRCEECTGMTGEGTLETANSKYVVVKMKARNVGETDVEDASIAPDLTTLIPGEDGGYAYPTTQFHSANENYHMQWGSNGGSSFPIYYDDMCYTEGTQRLKHSLFRPMAAGEEREYTLIYVVDEDQTDNLYLEFYSWENGMETPYVKITK